ncbi:hypothetical protein QZH41_001278 [Actinostola sp. cb2023]|nr:hypothetical protein QZH41_001278 [Actinostola sp. cb2023]
MVQLSSLAHKGLMLMSLVRTRPKMASATNLQDRPVPSSIARDRSLESTSGKYKRRGNSDTVKVPLHERVRQFPDENFIVREGKLFCNACREILSTKKSVLKIHVSSKKHQDGKQKMKRSKLREQTIAEAFKREESSKSKDSTLPVEECAYRLEVVTEFLKAGIPIAKIDMLRSLLEKNGYRLTGSSNLGQYVSMALKQEIERIKQELEMPGQVGMTRDIYVIFDGSTRQGEAIAIIVRFMDNDWNITQRLVRIEVCSKSVNANQLAQVLNQCLSVEYGVRGNSLLAAMRDGASVNQAALNIVSFIFPNMVNVVCFSHTLDNVGNHFEIPTLKEFGSLWIRMFRNSCKAKLLWKDLTGRAPKSYSETRWWSRWEVYQQLMVQFGDLERYMEEAKDAKVCPKILPQLQEILSDPQQHMLLKLELAATIDVGEHFVKATYFQEGDGPLIFSCYEKAYITTVFILVAWQSRLSSQQQCKPNVDSENNFALFGKTFKSLITKSYPECFLECRKDARCMSINFHTVKLECELNSQTKESRPQLYKRRENSIYTSNIHSRIPGIKYRKSPTRFWKTIPGDRDSAFRFRFDRNWNAEPVKGMKAFPGKSCLDILLSGEWIGTGEEYWIDPANTGTPIKVICDMTTDGGKKSQTMWTAIAEKLELELKELGFPTNDRSAQKPENRAVAYRSVP